MKLNSWPFSPLFTSLKHLSRSIYTMASSISETLTLTLTLPAGSPQDSNLDDHICSEQQEHQECQSSSADWPSRCLTGESRIERAWAHWKKLGQPKLIVAPMVDNSELLFGCSVASTAPKLRIRQCSTLASSLKTKSIDLRNSPPARYSEIFSCFEVYLWFVKLRLFLFPAL